MTIHIDLINHSTVISDAELAPLASVLTLQAHHLAEAGYDVSAIVRHYRSAPPATAWQLVILDDADQANALGYHETTAHGQPLGKVFARTVQQAGLSWTVTTSHEFVEMIVDPWAMLGSDLGGGDWVAWEACDPVEADADGYTIGGILVSDFVTPAWFEPDADGPYDWTRKLAAPLTLRPGGYVSIQTGGHWMQQLAREQRPDVVSRSAFAHRIDRRRARTATQVRSGGADFSRGWAPDY